MAGITSTKTSSGATVPMGPGQQSISQEYWESWSCPYAFSYSTSTQWPKHTGLGLRWASRPGSAAFLAERASEPQFPYCWTWDNSKKWGCCEKVCKPTTHCNAHSSMQARGTTITIAIKSMYDQLISESWTSSCSSKSDVAEGREVEVEETAWEDHTIPHFIPGLLRM